MKPCERCEEPAIHKERYCKRCKGEVKAEAYEAGKVRDWRTKVCTEAGGRKCRSTRLLNGTADNIRERYGYEE